MARGISNAVIAVFLVSAVYVDAEGGPISGLYRITSGSYLECCGFVGMPSVFTLPDDSQEFVEFRIDPQNNSTQMTFLGPDLQSVFTNSPAGPGSGFTFTFSNGMVLPDHIQFVAPASTPAPDRPSFTYTVSNLVDQIRIDGVVEVSPVGADIPTQFSHTNVLAVLVSPATLIDGVGREGGAIHFHFIGQPPFDYTVEFADSLTAASWEVLATYRAKLQPIDVVVTNSFMGAQARFFRVRQEPCFCR